MNPKALHFNKTHLRLKLIRFQQTTTLCFVTQRCRLQSATKNTDFRRIMIHNHPPAATGAVEFLQLRSIWEHETDVTRQKLSVLEWWVGQVSRKLVQTALKSSFQSERLRTQLAGMTLWERTVELKLEKVFTRWILKMWNDNLKNDEN